MHSARSLQVKTRIRGTRMDLLLCRFDQGGLWVPRKKNRHDPIRTRDSICWNCWESCRDLSDSSYTWCRSKFARQSSRSHKAWCYVDFGNTIILFAAFDSFIYFLKLNFLYSYNDPLYNGWGFIDYILFNPKSIPPNDNESLVPLIMNFKKFV